MAKMATALARHEAAAAPQRATWTTRWRDHLLAEVDGASIGLFRALFGLIMVWEVVRYFQNGWIARYYITPEFHFSYLPLVQPWPGQGMYWHFFATGLLALLVALGLWYRVAAWLFCLAFSYIFLLDKAQYLNHFYLIALLSLLLALIPAERAFSIDRARSRRPGPPTLPRWGLLLLRFQVGMVYFYGGIAKLNADWLSGYPLGDWLARRADLALIGSLLAQPWSGIVFAWGGLLIDLAVPFLLLWRRTFWLGAAAAVGFNLLNAQIFSIGIFPWLMIAALVIFPRPGWPRNLLASRPPRVHRRSPMAAGSVGAATVALLIGLHLYVAAQALVPLRHWLHPSDVAWSEEGHRFSWRMKLRDKEAVVSFFATNPLTGERQEVDPLRWLSERQLSKMAARPDMILQFAQFLAAEAERRGEPRPQITVEAWAGLNGRPLQLLIDPAANLAEVEASLGPAAWITPYQPAQAPPGAASGSADARPEGD